MAGRVDKARELTNGTQTDDAWPVEAFGLRCGAADGEVVWFWHTLLVLNSRRLVAQPGIDKTLSADDGDKTNSSPGRARYKR
jgi:hypothetical protein